MIRISPVLAVLCSLGWTGTAGAQRDPLAPLVEEGIRNNIALLQERLAERASAARVREARGLYLPSVDIAASYAPVQSGGADLGALINPAYAALNQLTGTNQFPTDLEIVIPFRQDMRVRASLPVVNPEIWAANAIADAQRRAQQGQLGAAARQLAASVQGGYLRFGAASRAVELYRSTLEVLDENLRVNERLVAAGRGTPDLVLRARAERAEAAQLLDDAERQRDAARRALNQLLGRPIDQPMPLLADTALLAVRELSLDAALASARERREELARARAGIDATRGQVRLASAGFLPSLAIAFDYGWLGNELRFTSDNDVAVGTIALQWNLFAGGRTRARRDAARLAEQQARAALADAERLVELDVRQAHDAWITGRLAVATATERLAAASRTFELVRRRYEEGLAAYVEFLDARTAFTSAGLNQIITTYTSAARWVELERAAALRTLPL